jgi:hypothetical protein
MEWSSASGLLEAPAIWPASSPAPALKEEPRYGDAGLLLPGIMAQDCVVGLAGLEPRSSDYGDIR